MTVGEVCNREVVIIGRAASVSEAARLMREHHVGDVVVAEERGEEQVPVGILTDRDIVVGLVAQGIDPGTMAVADLMSFELVTAAEADELLEAMKTMRRTGVRRTPVVNVHGALVGILAVDDLIDLVAEQLSDLVHLISVEQHRERDYRR